MGRFRIRFTARFLKTMAVMATVVLFVCQPARAQSADPGMKETSKAARPATSPVAAPFEARENEMVGREEAVGGLGDAGQAPVDLNVAPAFNAWRVAWSLGLVIAAIYTLSVLLRKINLRALQGASRSRHLRVLDQLPLGLNRSLYLIHAGRRVLLVGSSDKGLERLAEFDDPEEVLSILDEFEEERVAGGFGAALAEAAGKMKGTK